MPNVGDIIKATDLQDLLEQINANSSNIVGELKYFGFSEVPEHCLMCDGSEISRETYSELFAKYGTTYGEGDGSTTFNLPDYRGAFFRCIGGNADSIGVLQEDAIRNIKDTISHRAVNVRDTLFNPETSQIFSQNISSNKTARTIEYHGTTSYMMWDINIDISHAVPTADENRPINYAVNVCVIYE